MFQKVVEEIVHVSAKKERTLNAHTTVGIRATAGAIALFAGGPHTISHFLATPHCCVGKRAQRTVKIVKTVKTVKTAKIATPTRIKQVQLSWHGKCPVLSKSYTLWQRDPII